MSDMFGSGNFDEIMAQVQKLQDKVDQAKESAEFVGTSGGGAVSISVDGEFHFSSVHIDPKVIDKDSPDLLEDLVLAALHDAAQQVQDNQKNAVGQAMSSAFNEFFGGDSPDISSLLSPKPDSDTPDR